MKAVRGKSIEPSVGENENLELREQKGGGGMREAGGQRERERGRKFHHCRRLLCTASSRSRGNIDIFIFPLNLICVMDELPVL